MPKATAAAIAANTFATLKRPNNGLMIFISLADLLSAFLSTLQRSAI